MILLKQIMIGIPAYNEEKNIGGLLEDIFNQKLENKFDVLVVSDNSSDMTDNIVLSFMKKHENVKIIKKEKRTGKPSSLHMIFDGAKDYDTLILLDADIKLADNSLNILLEKFFKNDADLVAGNPIIPFPDKILSIGSQAAYFGWAFGARIKNTHKYSLYHVYGCILALSKRIYNDMKISVGIGDDTYIYLYCMQKNLKFEYEPNAKVYIETSKNIKDYFKQNIRRTSAYEELKKIFGREFVDTHARINNKYQIFLRTFTRYPYKCLCWMMLYTYEKIFERNKRANTAIWKISKTTKMRR